MVRVKPSSKPTVVCCVIASWIQSRLERVEKQREQGRQSRIKADVPTVSLVGYTNAGKSTLFNRITKRGSTWQTSCLPPSTRRCGVLTLQMSVKPCWRDRRVYSPPAARSGCSI
ncbi:GTPase [Escherichia coli]